MEELIKLLNYYTDLYNKGESPISDREWDELYFKLKQMEQETGTVMCGSPTQTIQYSVSNGLKKVKHNHDMLSLDKTKDWNNFVSYFGDKDVIGMLKLDGLTCTLEYLDGELIGAETRGNGEIGEDILHNAKVIPSIPYKIAYKEHLIIDGEIICKLDDFEEFSKDYANARNFASGSIRLLDSKECAKRKLTFVAWNIVEGFNKENSFLKKLDKIEKLGFIIVPWTSSFDFDAKDFLVQKAEQLKYPIDGLVGRFDDIAYGTNLGKTSHHSKAAYAFKFYDEMYPTTLLDIEWGLGRSGQLTPVAVFEPIEIENSIVNKASLHNISIMNELSGGSERIGDTLYIFKANAIIPQVGKWEHNGNYSVSKHLFIPEICPSCGGKTKIIESDTGIKVLICTNPQCQGKLINQLENWFSKKGLDIKGLSKATLEKLISWNWVNSPKDIYELKQHRDEWIKKPGFGIKSVDNILAAIEDSRDTTLESFIAAIGIPLIGKNVAKELVKYIDSYEDFREKIKKHWDFSQIDGFSDGKSERIYNFNFSNADEVYQYLNVKKEEKKDNSNTLQNLTFAITGKLVKFKNRAELVKYIENLGGKVVGAVSKNVNYLINNDKNSASSKIIRQKNQKFLLLMKQNFLTY